MKILVFVPVGVLVAFFVRRSWGRVLPVAAAFSLTIELAQLTTARLLSGGHVADINDLIFNVVGAALGAGLLAVMSRVPGANRVIERLRWR